MATETLERKREGEVDDAESLDESEAAVGSIPIPNLHIKGFRGIDELDIPKLTQVTLIAGKNGIGKTTLLEAMRVFASRGSGSVLTGILRDRREMDLAVDEEGDPTIILDWESLFYGRSPSEADDITIAVRDRDEALSISIATPQELETDGVEFVLGPLSPDTVVLRTGMQKARRYVPMIPDRNYRSLRRRREFFEKNYPPEIQFETIGPDVLGDDQIARMWDDIALSDELNNVVASLTEMYGRRINGIAMTGNERRSRQLGRRAMVRLTEGSRPVPLKSLGDGAMRITGNIMAVSRGDTDLVLVDEIENGVHHFIQKSFWNTLIDAASRNRTQLIATTHSWDCIKGFASAALDNRAIECSLVRIGTTRITKKLRAVEYPIDKLTAATRHGIEVR